MSKNGILFRPTNEVMLNLVTRMLSSQHLIYLLSSNRKHDSLNLSNFFIFIINLTSLAFIEYAVRCLIFVQLLGSGPGG